MKGLFGSIDETAEGAEHLLGMEGSHLIQGIEKGIDIFVLSQVFHLFADEEVTGKEPSLIRFIKADMVIRMSRGRNDQKMESLGFNL